MERGLQSPESGHCPRSTRGNRVSAWEGSGNLGSLGRELDPGGVELKKNSRVTVPVRVGIVTE